MNGQTVLSIGLPVFNGERFLEKALRSLLCQTFEDFELIICDNNSQDRTGEICRDYSRDDCRIRYVRNEENIGAARNFNKTFYLATGKYFKWAAADDLYLPTYVEKCLTVLEDRPDIVLCHTWTQLIDEEDKPLKYEPSVGLFIDSVGKYRLGPDNHSKGVSTNPFERFSDVLSKTPPCFDFFGVTRRQIASQTCLHGLWYGSDRAFLVEMALFGKLHQVPEGLFLAREHAGQSIVLDRKAQDSWVGSRSFIRYNRAGINMRIQLLRAVIRSPISHRDKLRCLALLAHRAADWNVSHLKKLLESGW